MQDKKKDNRGGPRPGSGRKPGVTPLRETFSIRFHPDTLKRLEPYPNRTAFIEAAVLEKLDRIGRMEADALTAE